jgi:ribosomal protein S18 acetylase RimI-like enzyme
MSASESTESSDFLVRQATRKDLDTIGDLWVELISFHATLDNRFGVPTHGRNNYIRHVYLALRDGNYRVLVAESHGLVIGYVMGYIAQNPPIFPTAMYGFIADLCVTQSVRRHGVGEALVQSLCQWFTQNRMGSIQLNVAHHNPVSQAFWRKMGCTDYLHQMWMKL